MVFRSVKNEAALVSAHAEAEDKKLRKDPTLGGPCFEGTLRKCFLSESSPVAGTIESFKLSETLDARCAPRVAHNTPGQPHHCSR
jgi:hypothetical protein